MAAENITWRTFVNGAEIIRTWNLTNTPTFYVIDHRGIIRHKWVGSPADYKLGGMPAPEVIEGAIEKLVRMAEAHGK